MLTSKSNHKHPSIAKLPNYKITLDMQNFINSKESRHNTIDDKENIPTEELRRVSNRQRHMTEQKYKRKKKSKSKSKNRKNTDYVQIDQAKYRAQSNTSGKKYNQKDIRYQELYSIYHKPNVEQSTSVKYLKGRFEVGI